MTLLNTLCLSIRHIHGFINNDVQVNLAVEIAYTLGRVDGVISKYFELSDEQNEIINLYRDLMDCYFWEC